MSRKTFLVTLFSVLAVAGIPFLYVAKWEGRFALTLGLDVASEIDESSIRYVECWNSEEVDWLMNNRSQGDATLQPPETKTANPHCLMVTCGGDSGAYGIYDTYHQPRFLFVQYRMLGAKEDNYACKLLEIPLGHGPRSTILTLP